MRGLGCVVVLFGPGCAPDESTIDEDQPPVTGACAPTQRASDSFADCVDAFAPAPGVTFGHALLPRVALGPPAQDTTPGNGSVDVVSLGCGGAITLMFDGEGIVDRDGPDLVVFENAFATGETTFAEPARVLVSQDGVVWHAFPCDASGDGSWPPTGCAGVTPTAPSPDGSFDPTRAGGDVFDLADVDLPWARWLRLVDVTAEHYGDAMWCGGAAGGFDLDAAAAMHPWPAPRLRDDAEPRR